MIVEEEDIVRTTGGGEGTTLWLISGDHGGKLIELDGIGADEVITGNQGSWWGEGGF